MYLREIRQLTERIGVSQGDEDEAVVNKHGHRAKIYGLLAAARATCGNE